MLSCESGRSSTRSRKIPIGPVRAATSGSLRATRTYAQSVSAVAAESTKSWRRRRRAGSRNSGLCAPRTALIRQTELHVCRLALGGPWGFREPSIVLSQLVIYVPAHGGIEEHGGSVPRRFGFHDSFILESLERSAKSSQGFGGK